jgi:hypothetical protein
MMLPKVVKVMLMLLADNSPSESLWAMYRSTVSKPMASSARSPKQSMR